MANNPPNGEKSSLQGKLNGNFSAGFSKDLKPTTIQGSSQFNVQNGSGNLAELGGLAAQFTTDVSPTEVKQVAHYIQTVTKHHPGLAQPIDG